MACHHTFSALMLALAVGLVVGPAAGLAQTQAPEPPAAQEQVDIDPSEEQLQAFAAATVRIVKIQQQAQQDMQSAVQDSGLTIDEYNAIAQKAQTDEDIDEQLRNMIGQELGG